MPKVSVIIPVYGVEKYIERCARSLFEQTLDDIEFIFVNDCTKDNSIKILERVIEDYPQRQDQIKIINMPLNSGQAKVREIGTKSARGEYLIHCDSDDWVDKDMYRIMYEKAKNEDADIVFCDYYVTDGSNHKYTKYFSKDGLDKKNLLKKLFCNSGCCHSIWSALCRVNLYYDHTIVFPIANMREDYVIMTQMFYYSKTIEYIEQSLYYYYQNPNSIMHTSDLKRRLDIVNQIKTNTDIIVSFLNEKQEFKYAFFMKVNARLSLSSLRKETEYNELWTNSLYPEIKGKILFNFDIPFKLRRKFLILQIYNMFPKCIRKFLF